jgi:hypothetical protein
MDKCQKRCFLENDRAIESRRAPEYICLRISNLEESKMYSRESRLTRPINGQNGWMQGQRLTNRSLSRRSSLGQPSPQALTHP